MSESPAEPLTFNTLGNYRWPAAPTDESLRRFSWKLWKRFDQSDTDPFISDSSLEDANTRRLDRIAAPPACDPVLDEMRATFDDWLHDEDPSRLLQLVVLPPGDTNNLVASWATANGHCVVDPPPRETLLDRTAKLNVAFDGDQAVVVIPRLERWFLRHQDGMTHVRSLLEQASRSKCHCVIGCNSWAWQFLDNAIDAGRLMPLGLTSNAFHAERLRAWLLELAEKEGEADHVFRLSKSGDIISNDFFANLAARSLGIPWVAWQMWRRSLRLGPPEGHANKQKFPEEKTLWLSDLEEFNLPKRNPHTTLFALHALLIHGTLTADELDAVTPSVDACNVLHALQSADFIEQVNDGYRLIPAAYPAVRAGLAGAGYPKDQL